MERQSQILTVSAVDSRCKARSKSFAEQATPFAQPAKDAPRGYRPQLSKVTYDFSRAGESALANARAERHQNDLTCNADFPAPARGPKWRGVDLSSAAWQGLRETQQILREYQYGASARGVNIRNEKERNS